ncbi:MAG TPA: hypothetical protein DCX07_01015 [Phycisphaerales bacterium]|nr:hypothetical protein [Phycisphaerales bacterium]
MSAGRGGALPSRQLLFGRIAHAGSAHNPRRARHRPPHRGCRSPETPDEVRKAHQDPPRPARDREARRAAGPAAAGDRRARRGDPGAGRRAQRHRRRRSAVDGLPPSGVA